jgi:hypothetical protein
MRQLGRKVIWACLSVLLFSGMLLAQGYADVARNTGHRDGLEKGANDARQAKSFNLDRHDYYKDADHGYRDSFRNKAAYKQTYRDAFRRGYQEGYNEYSGRGGRGRDERGQRPGVGPRGGSPGSPGSPGGMRRPSTPVYAQTASNTGNRDGREKGANDARQGKSYSLDRHDYYKDADHGYRDSFNNKEDYKRLYRDAFRRGYTDGYRQRK